jgi:hypothetical protein
MSNTIDYIPQAKRGAQARVCAVAYTLNNRQPVRCTIIGDQPLFYMDNHYGTDDEDDGLFFHSSDLDNLESEIESLKKEIESFDRMAQEFNSTPEKEYQDYIEDRDFIVAPVKKRAEESPALLIEALSKSRLAKAYIDFAKEHKVEIKYCLQTEDASYERRAGLILINPLLAFSDRILLAARELRRHWQHRQGALINPLMFHPDNAVLINRIQSADLTVSMIRMAWELQLSGERAAWERIENSSLSDLGHAFAREAFLDFRTINNGEAGAAVVESWFLSERCRHEDKKLIKQMLADYKGYVFDHEEAQKSLTPALIAALGSVPYGKNYLAPHTNTLLNDPVFTDVRDRSNANFLWFIKFERSFRESERDLQGSGDPSARDVRSQGKSNKKAQEQKYDNEPARSAEIIAIYPESENSGDKTQKSDKILPPKSFAKRNNKKKGGADIVYLRRWSGE